ncbi:DUF2057 family protein [Psychromonas sp. SP041]|uniref:DUF2057 family protein n=1 Tax=Psychromonas sp. SP041 TaxID=1365007 RepID=UPI0010C79212|nr:DUF2057 family protein [Psychromonas sp. SP041]
MKFTGLFLTLAISPFAFSGEIVTSNDVQVLAINGTKVQSSFLGEKKLETEDGKQQIVVKYTNNFRDGGLLESRPYILTVDVKGKTEITTTKLYSYPQASQKLRTGLEWFVESEKGQYQLKDAEQLQGDGFIPYSDIEGLISAYNNENDIAVTSNSVKKITTNSLIQQYKAADLEQKKQFKMWLINSETK